MAEYFLSNTAENFVEKLGSFALREVCSAFGLETELDKIKDMLIAIKAVISDAEHQQVGSQGIKLWVEKLTQLIYDAEDVLDEFDYEVLRKQVVKCMSTSRKVRGFFSTPNPLVFRFKMSQKLKNIRERVVEIADLRSKLGLTERVSERHVIHRERGMTHSFVDVAQVTGREKNKEEILELLFNVVDGDNVSIIPIVGIGGLGKTTLAKFVYNDRRVDNHFDMKLWVCISDEFDLQKVIIKILKSVGKKYVDGDMDQLQKELRETLYGKRYLLVMDDVWNEDRRKWLELKYLLIEGAKGSQILVTTRSQSVAASMGRIGRRYDLDGLPHENCSSLFFKCAFEVQGEEQRYPKLQKIGEEIVWKCKGVPLAVITLGGLLYSTRNELDWKYVRDSEIWRLEQKENDILPALRLSYEQLPSYLKRCFAYCSLFPKDCQFLSCRLIQFWMAHGLLQSSNRNEELEDVGTRYFNELWSRGFFQDFEEILGFVKCKMHDLVHDLALLVSQNECSIVTSTNKRLSKNVRHLSFYEPHSFLQDYFSSLDNSKQAGTILEQARTIIFLNSQQFNCESIIQTCFARLKHVRAIDLVDCQFEVLPRRIGTLKHLRYLNFADNSQIKELPNVICKLQFLQTLVLLDCGLEELPRDIKYMISLRYLLVTLKGNTLAKDGIGCLKSLRTLGFVSCENLQYLIEDMQNLVNLRHLFIIDCSKLISLPGSIKYLTRLEMLLLFACESLDLSMKEEEEDNSDLSQLKLHKLFIHEIPKLVELPRWLLPKSANTLQLLSIERCHSINQLPVWLQDQSAIQELRIQDCNLLSERCKSDTGEDWHKIAHIPKVVVDGNNLK